MRIVGVIDVREGRAVHARGGDRTAYTPVETAAGERVGGDAVTLAKIYVDVLGVRELYVADLDAISRGVAAMNTRVLAGLVASDVPVWVDAGVSTARSARTVLDAGASTVIVGLETLTSFDALAAICAAVDGRSVSFSIDLRDGRPITLPNAAHSTWSVVQIAGRAGATDVGSLIVLDLARVGTGLGIDLGLMMAVRHAAPSVALFAGGGVRESADLGSLAAAGCDGALVATALLNGSIRPSSL